ncbi:MAG: hypothetical protein ACYDFT_06550 [Thermoplasmata archaeon]
MAVPFPSRPPSRLRTPSATGAEPTRGVLTELARGFLRGLTVEDPGSAQRFASQFLTEQSGHPAPPLPVRRGPILRAPSSPRSISSRD